MGNTTKQISARARARAASARAYELEREREEVAVRYFDAIDAIDKVNEAREREIARAHERAERASANARAAAAAAIRALADLDVSRPEIAARLDCSAADVRRALSAEPDADAVSDYVDTEILDGDSDPAEDTAQHPTTDQDEVAGSADAEASTSLAFAMQE